MSKPVVEVQIRAVAATSGGFAVFLGNQDKAFVIFVDQSVGAAIAMFIQGTQKERPLTHDLVANILRALGAKTEPIEVVSGSRRQSMATSKRRRISRKTDCVLGIGTPPFIFANRVLTANGMDGSRDVTWSVFPAGELGNRVALFGHSGVLLSISAANSAS
jgi:hypothetical protein